MPKVKAVVSFCDASHGAINMGQEFDLPDGVDWLDARLVVELEQPKPKGKKGDEPPANEQKPAED